MCSGSARPSLGTPGRRALPVRAGPRRPEGGTAFGILPHPGYGLSRRESPLSGHPRFHLRGATRFARGRGSRGIRGSFDRAGARRRDHRGIALGSSRWNLAPCTAAVRCAARGIDVAPPPDHAATQRLDPDLLPLSHPRPMGRTPRGTGTGGPRAHSPARSCERWLLDRRFDADPRPRPGALAAPSGASHRPLPLGFDRRREVMVKLLAHAGT